MTRIAISAADCTLLEVVLALSFDAGELINCGVTPAGEGLHAAVRAAHRACHDDARVATLLQRRLDLIHREELDALETRGLADYAQELLTPDLGDVACLAGKLWALTTCDDHHADCLRAHLRGRLVLAGAESLRNRRMSA